MCLVKKELWLLVSEVTLRLASFSITVKPVLNGNSKIVKTNVLRPRCF